MQRASLKQAAASRLLLLSALAALSATSVSAQQSLGDIARQNRAKNAANGAPKKVITNDDLGVPSEGRATPKDDTAATDANAAPSKDNTKSADKAEAKDDNPQDAAALL